MITLTTDNALPEHSRGYCLALPHEEVLEDPQLLKKLSLGRRAVCSLQILCNTMKGVLSNAVWISILLEGHWLSTLDCITMTLTGS